MRDRDVRGRRSVQHHVRGLPRPPRTYWHLQPAVAADPDWPTLAELDDGYVYVDDPPGEFPGEDDIAVGFHQEVLLRFSACRPTPSTSEGVDGAYAVSRRK